MISLLRRLIGVALVTAGVLTVHDFTYHKIRPEKPSLPIPKECNEHFDCSVDWISTIMEYPIQTYHVERIYGGLSTSQSYRLYMDNKGNPFGPTSLFVKYLNEANKEPFALKLYWFIFGTKEYISRKEDYFYKQLHTKFRTQNIESPYPYYAGAEDNGDRSLLFNLLGFKSHFRSVLILEDLYKHDNFSSGTKIPEQYVISATQKLAQFHRLNIYANPRKNMLIPEYYNNPQIYQNLFHLSPNFLSKYPDKLTINHRIQLWENQQPLFREPRVRDALYTFAEHYGETLKFFHNDPADGPLFKYKTFLHGDFQPSNLFYMTKSQGGNKEIKNLILCDWQGYGYGHPTTELAYFLSFIDPDPVLEAKIMETYYETLTQSKKIFPREKYPYPVFVRECEVRALGLGISAFNMYKDPPDILQKKKEELGNNMDFDQTFRSFEPRMNRFVRVVEKWKNENIFERIDKIKEEERGRVSYHTK